MAIKTVDDLQVLCTRLSVKQIRNRVRELGLKAPPTGLSGMNPKLKYEWEEGSLEWDRIKAYVLQKDAEKKTGGRPRAIKE